ncbi:uncharacterized protein ACRADG_008377 [Cochliomyia hominivorax]
MSSDSDSDDDTQMRHFLEAADTTLLNNSMFQKKNTNFHIELCPKNDIKEPVERDIPKSQRYLSEDNENTGTDFNLPESMQNFLSKKLTEILKQHYEFYDEHTEEVPKLKMKTKYKNRVKLLKGDECYVKPYEEFEYESKGPEKKPEIKKRNIDKTGDEVNKENKLKLIAVDGNYILSGEEIKFWANKKQRKEKVFHYKLASTGILHAKEEVNEFTELRQKNKWNESKIKKFKRCK